MTVVVGQGSETELWRRCLEGDSSAFATLFDPHVDAVYRFCLYRTRRVADAEDLTSAVFLALWQRRSELDLRTGSVSRSSTGSPPGSSHTTTAASVAPPGRSGDCPAQLDAGATPHPSRGARNRRRRWSRHSGGGACCGGVGAQCRPRCRVVPRAR